MTTTKNDDGTVTVTLAYPITVADGSKQSELLLKRPNAKQLRAMDKGDGKVSSTMELLQAMTAIPMPFLDMLDGQDYIELSDALNGFLGKSPKTGDDSQP